MLKTLCWLKLKKKRKRDYTTSKAAIQIRKKKTSIHFLSHPSSSSRVLPDYPHHAQALSAVREKKTMFEQPSDALYCFEKDTNRCSGKKKKKREPNGKQKTVIMRSNVPSRSQFCSSQDTQSSLPRLSCLFIFFLFLFFFFLLAISKSSLSLQRKSRRLQRFSKFNGSVG